MATESGARPRLFWWIVGALALTALLMYLRFPYERLADRISLELETRGGWRVDLVDLGPHPTLLGPGLAAGPVTIEPAQGGAPLELDRVRLRPAWSTSWLAFEPALYVEVDYLDTEIEATLTLASPLRVDANLVDADLERLAASAAALSLSGRLDADLSLTLAPEGPVGPIRLAAREGSFGHPSMPLEVPFERFDAMLSMGGDAWLTVASAEIQSPMLGGSVQGTVGPPPGGAVDLVLDLEPSDAAAALLRAQGFRADRGGHVELRVGGSVARPVLR